MNYKIEYPATFFIDFMYSSTIFPVPSGELSSTTIASKFIFGKCSLMDFKTLQIFSDSLNVGIITET